MESTLPIDPVCGMKVDPSTPLRMDHRGTTYYFCAPSCLERFKSNPATFLDRVGAERAGMHDAASASDPDAIYTCPMHPEVRQQGPGACPICGMALEPATVSLDEGPNPELIDMTRRFWIAAALALPVVLLAMADMLLGPGL